MKITHSQVGQNLNTSDLQKSGKSDKAKGVKGELPDLKSEKASSAGSAESATKVELSPRAQQMKRASEVMKATPDVDEAKVGRLQKMIDEGKYKMDSGAVAEKMLEEQMSWE
jgi:negative regulator of flagellin synthesis FlgM